jgi:uncharacterized protein (TIRG00374 family)
MRKRITLFIVSILLVLLTINFFGVEQVFSIILKSNASLLTFALVLQVVIMFLYAVRYKIITSKYKHISLKDALYISTLGNFISSLTPVAKIGGQPLMIYMTKKKIGNEKASAVVITDTIIDNLTSIVMVIAILILFFAIIPLTMLFPFLIFIFVALGIIFGFMKLFLSKTALSRVFGWFARRLGKGRNINTIFHVSSFEHCFKMVLEDRILMSIGMFVSMLIKALEVVRIWIVFAAIGIALSVSTLWIIWAFMLMILLVPWLPGHLGLYEFGVSSGFIMLGVASSEAAAGVLLDRFVSFWFVIVFALVILWLSRQQLREVFHIADKKKR